MRTLTPPEIFALVNTLNAADIDSLEKVFLEVKEEQQKIIIDICLENSTI